MYNRLPVSLLILVIYALLALGLTYPLVFHLDTAVPNDIGDPLLNTWILAWDDHTLLTNPLDLFKANIFYPLPNTLAYSEHLFSVALLALPLQLVSAEPLVAYNLSLLAAFPLAAFGMYLLTFRWTRQRSAAFIAGLIFAFTPYRFAAIAHLQLLTIQWLPLVVLSLDKLLTVKQIPQFRPIVRRRLLFILLIFLTLQLLTSWYLAIYTIVIISVYLLAYLIAGLLTKSPLAAQLWPLLFSTCLISFLLILPFAWPYFSLLDDLRLARPLSLALSLAAAPTDFIAAAPFNRIFGPLTEIFRARPGFTEENTLFSGFVAPLLALLSIVAIVLRLLSSVWPIIHRPQSTTPNPQPPRYIAPNLSLFTSHFSLLTFHLPLLLLLSLSLTFAAPYTTLAALFPPSTIVRVPTRWIIPALFALTGLAACGYTHLTFYLSRLTFASYRLTALRLLFFLTCAALLAETFSVPLPLASVENHTALNPAYRWLAAQPGNLALIELPLFSAPAPEYPEVKRLYASTLGWWKLVNGYSGYTPPRQPQLAQSLADFPGPQSVAALQTLASISTSPPLPFLTNRPLQPLREPSTPQSPSSLLPFFLLVHPGEAPFDRSRWETIDRWQAERNPALHPLGQFEGDYLYQVLPSDSARFTTPPLAVFGQTHPIYLLTYNLTLSNSSQPPTPIPQPLSPALTLYWQSTIPISTTYTVFIHLRAPDGFVHSQADGPPVSGHYPTAVWQPNEIIQDIHPWPQVEARQIDHLAVGLYDPITGRRLPAFSPDGKRLAEDAVIIRLTSQ